MPVLPGTPHGYVNTLVEKVLEIVANPQMPLRLGEDHGRTSYYSQAMGPPDVRYLGENSYIYLCQEVSMTGMRF